MLTSQELVWLLAGVAKGDRPAFQRLYETTRAKLYGVVLRILQRAELADEVIRDTYLQIRSSAGQFDPAKAVPITWMVAIARNRTIDLVRSRTEIPPEEALDVLAVGADTTDGPDPLDGREMSEDLRRLLACLGRLDEDRRKLVLLAYYNGWSRERLATALDKPVNTIKSWLRRSATDIRECLGP
jgi:RNA polymerase sigma-70 factor (ECF subfamily)